MPHAPRWRGSGSKEGSGGGAWPIGRGMRCHALQLRQHLLQLHLACLHLALRIPQLALQRAHLRLQVGARGAGVLRCRKRIHGLRLLLAQLAAHAVHLTQRISADLQRGWVRACVCMGKAVGG